MQNHEESSEKVSPLQLNSETETESARPHADGSGDQRNGPTKGSLAIIFATVFIDLLGFGMVLPLLPIYAKAFDSDPAGWKLGMLMAIFSIMQFFMAPVWGSLSDRIGRRPVLMVGLFGSVIFYTLFGLATVYQSYWMLFVTRLGAGIFGATIPTAQAYIADTTTKENRAKGMALIGMAFGMGFTFGPLIGFLAVPSGQGDPGPLPGFLAAGLSGLAFLSAIFFLPESLRKDSESGARKLLDVEGIRLIAKNRSVIFVLATIFLCVFSFAKFETTLSILIKDTFEFDFKEVCLTYAFIGFTLAIIQGGFVRPMSKRIPESVMATAGALLEVVGFAIVIAAIEYQSKSMLFTSLIVIVTGFSCLQPSLNSLLSRRSDPKRQGIVLGVGQSVNAMARILGSALGIPILMYDLSAPYFLSAAMMLLGAVAIFFAIGSGKDYSDKDSFD